jgi:hypothetical protein
VNGYTGTFKEFNDASVLDHDEHRRAHGRRRGFMRLLIYVSILVFAPLVRGEATDKRDVGVRATQASVVTVDEPRKKPGEGKVRRSVRARATQAARGAVHAAGWLLNTDEVIPPAQGGGGKAAARQTKRQ